MSVADKYMSEANNKKFKFIPPQFNKSIFESLPLIRQSETLELFPSETKNEQMYCYYNEINGCSNQKEDIKLETRGDSESILVNIPSPCEILRKYNFAYEYENNKEEQRNDNNLEKVYLDVINKNPSIINSLLEYKIPVPIAKLITKKIVRLSLECNKECNIL